ncbi:hypothetical protein ACHAWF_003306 [Thalassiosira exigua]
MTITTAAPGGGAYNAAKRKFFQRQDPYAKHYHPHKLLRRGDDAAELFWKSSSSTCTVYGSAWSPPHRGNRRYIVACTSNGCIAVWGHRSHSNQTWSSRDDGGEKKSGPAAPLFVVRVGGEGRSHLVLYDLKFIRTNNEDLLVVSGDPGVLLYKWRDFEAVIDARDGRDCTTAAKPKCQDPQNKKQSSRQGPFVEIDPVATFQPHPSPAASFGEPIEINSTSFIEQDGTLFGAAGDVFGCYRWDLATETLLGTFGGASRYDGGGHRDYLHVVKALPEEASGGSRVVVTGGEDGNMGFWDGKTGKMIEMVNVQSVMDKNKNLLTSNASASNTNRGFMSNSSSSWVSSMDANGDWLAVCGGVESANNSITARSGPNSSGFLALWHLPSRKFTSGSVTRESLNAVVYNPSLDSFVTGGNEGRISFWEPTTLVRSGRSWCTPPSTYTISVGPSMLVGGVGGTLDCFVDRVKVSQMSII